MTTMEIVALLNVLAIVLVAVINGLFGIVMIRVSNAVKETHTDMKTLEKNTNSKLDTLIIAKEKAARAEGRAEGVASQKDVS